MIIDGHVHIGKTEKSERYFTFESYREFAEHNIIGGAVVMPNISNKIKTYDLNYDLLEGASKYKNSKFKYFPFILIDPFEKLICQQIKRYSKEIYGLKYHPSVNQVEISHKELQPFIQKAKIYQIPILVHCGRNSFSDIKYVIEACKQNPDVNFIAAHLGGNATDLIEQAIYKISVNKNLNNLYLDTSAVKLPWLIELAVEKLGFDKIIFGSDEPYADLRIAKYCVELCNIDRRGAILSKNISKLLKVESDENTNIKSKSNKQI